MRRVHACGSRLRTAAVLACALACSSEALQAPEPEARAAPPALPRLEIEPATLSRPERQPRPPALRLLQEGRFTLDVQGADLRSLLAGLVRSSPFSLVVSPDVSGEVTADLRDVSLFDILEQLVVPRGYAYEVDDSLIRVGPPELETRTYHVDYPSYKRDGSSALTVYGAIETAPNMGAGTASASDDTSASSLSTAQQLDFWTELKASLDALVARGAEDAGARQVLVAEQSGLVLVRAEAEVLAEVEGLLSEMERSNQQQVLIDTRIVEVTLSDDLDLGVDLELARGFKGSTTGALARLIDPTRRNAVVVTNLSQPLTNGGFSFGVASDRLSARLRALAAQTDVRVVSTPRVATLNNHKALIKVVRNQVFFVAETDVQIVEGVGTTTTTEFVPKVIPIGVTLDVTPRISQDDEITLHIHPSVSEVVAVQPQPSTDPNAQTGSLPVIDLRETDTVVRVHDAETIVIGGLMRSRNLDMEKKVPLLGDLPWLGQLFRSTNVEELRTELIILLTPRVLEGPRVYRVADEAQASLGAVNQLRLERRPVRPWWRVPRGASYGGP